MHTYIYVCMYNCIYWYICIECRSLVGLCMYTCLNTYICACTVFLDRALNKKYLRAILVNPKSKYYLTFLSPRSHYRLSDWMYSWDMKKPLNLTVKRKEWSLSRTHWWRPRGTGGDGPCIRPPNISRSSVVRCVRKYEVSKESVMKEFFHKRCFSR